MKAIAINVGDEVQICGAMRLSRADGSRLEAGCVGRVVEVHPPRAGLGFIVDLDGDEVPDPDRDGYAVVDFPTWGRRMICPENEGQTWRRVAPKSLSTPERCAYCDILGCNRGCQT